MAVIGPDPLPLNDTRVKLAGEQAMLARYVRSLSRTEEGCRDGGQLHRGGSDALDGRVALM